MSRFILFLMAGLLLMGAAARADDDSMLEDIVKKAMIDTAKGVAPELIVKNLKGDVATFAHTGLKVLLVEQDIEAIRDSKTDTDRMINSLVLGARIYNMTTQEGGAYLTYLQIVKNLIAYGKAQTEREKYFIAASTGAAVASFFPFGWIAEIAVMHQQLNDAYVTKYYTPVIEEMMEKNNQLGVQIREQLVERANAEAQFIQTLMTEAQYRLIAAEAIGEREKVECDFQDIDKAIMNAQACALDEDHYFYQMSVAAKLLRAVMDERLEIIKLEDINKLYNWEPGRLQKLATDVQNSVAQMDEERNKKAENLRRFILELQDGLTLVKWKDEKDRVVCLSVTQEKVTPVIARLKNAAAPSIAERPLLKRQLIEAQTAFQDNCSHLKGVPARTQSLLDTLLQQIHYWNGRI